ncbi:J domain-containing protein [Actinophytocola sp. KF-1]
MSEPHRVLGVREDATQEEITAAYHRLVRRYHPDAADDGTAPERFREVVAAYTALRDQPPAPAPKPAPPRRTQEPDLRAGPVRYHGPPRR